MIVGMKKKLFNDCVFAIFLFFPFCAAMIIVIARRQLIWDNLIFELLTKIDLWPLQFGIDDTTYFIMMGISSIFSLTCPLWERWVRWIFDLWFLVKVDLWSFTFLRHIGRQNLLLVACALGSFLSSKINIIIFVITLLEVLTLCVRKHSS